MYENHFKKAHASLSSLWNQKTKFVEFFKYFPNEFYDVYTL